MTFRTSNERLKHMHFKSCVDQENYYNFNCTVSITQIAKLHVYKVRLEKLRKLESME